jgi:hypothetical protein
VTPAAPAVNKFALKVCLNFEVVCIDLKFGSSEFHERIVDGKNDLENVSKRHYLLGSRKCNIIHTRLRHQCSSLGADLFRANIVSDPSCTCGCPLADAIHYLLECLLYTNARM